MVLIFFLLKLAIYFDIWKFIQLDWMGPLGIMTTRLVAPFSVHLWQILSAANALLAWVFFFRAHRHLLARGTAELSEEVVTREYVAFQSMRTAFSLFTIACTFYIAAATALDTEWPPIRIILFPWGGAT